MYISMAGAWYAWMIDFLSLDVILLLCRYAAMISSGRTSWSVSVQSSEGSLYASSANRSILMLMHSRSVKSFSFFLESWWPLIHCGVHVMIASLHFWKVSSRSASASLWWHSRRPVCSGCKCLQTEMNEGCESWCTLTSSIIIISNATWPCTLAWNEDRFEGLPSTGPWPYRASWSLWPVVRVHEWVDQHPLTEPSLTPIRVVSRAASARWRPPSWGKDIWPQIH